MPIFIKPIESQSQWQAMEAKLAPHTFLQSWEWSLSQAALGQQIFRLGIWQDDQLRGLAFVYVIKAKRGNFLFCPHGPVINWHEAGEILPVLLNYLINLSHEIKADFIRISPLAPNTAQNKKIFTSLGFKQAPIHMMHPELAWLLDLAPIEDDLMANMEKRTRYSIRKAIKDGVKIRKQSDFETLNQFFDLYQKTADRQGFVPYSRDYLKYELQSFLNSNKIKIYFADYNNQSVAAAIIVYSNNSAFYHHGASIKYNNITASELLQWQAIKQAKDSGLRYYNFWGIVKPEDKNHPWAGLSKFKTGFGGTSEEYLHAQDFRLTSKYWLNYVVEKIRKIKRGY